MAEAVFSEDVPTMTRSGFMKSETASPSLRNSGFDTTSKAMSSPRAARAAADVGSKSPFVRGARFAVLREEGMGYLVAILSRGRAPQVVILSGAPKERSSDAKPVL